ncbi:Thymidylate synthase thyX [Acidisarcina polymorpha]|uniref:Thymidylate synthase thyX n=1 Tax=Acidisarcina polymorpha TaxID=2211140 RepID=A0A2Z5FUA3_9BACT|nr:FAD-dependent thymidylate synthase [Acidisarcina polymorpha]AXC10428.1 Thymidylate synthase thyX [Acidisarcina polymorpha]
MPTHITPSGPSAAPAGEHAENRTEVFAIHGADPEVLAYAMAKYSRSSLSMKQSLREISSQRAEQFLNTFYFQYGHRSIADLAHVAFAIERLSLLAAIALVDEQRWDGQERSTRYQNFLKGGWYLPDFGLDTEAREQYSSAIELLFSRYHGTSQAMLEYFKSTTPKPEEMKADAYERTLKARSFDVARYLLPLATNTSLGQIVNARTLETQISRLLSDPHEEVRQLGEKLRDAASGAAWNVHGAELAALQAEIAAADPSLGARAAELLTRDVKVAPTLVKYAVPSDYALATRRELEQAAQELMAEAPIDPAPVVDLVERDEPLEVELAATLLYGASHYSYRQIRDCVTQLPEARRNEIVDLGLRHRGRHDDLLREFSAGQTLRFDILMDIGGFRDMHRHRKCTQILQPFTHLHGYDFPEFLEEAGFGAGYRLTIGAAHETYRNLKNKVADASAQYVLPLGTRVRALFKMDFAEALYISELRSTPQGHFSYRRVAWEMYKAVARQHPSLAKYFRIRDVTEPIDLLKR